MRDRPQDLDETELGRALAAWDIDATALTHAPVGYGDHHWHADGADGRRWFVTVADLADKPYCGIGPDSAARGLGRAMDTAAALAARAGFGFVVAPLRTARAETVRRLGDRYGVSVFPHVDAAAGDFGQPLPDTQRGALLDLLGRLHRTPAPPTASHVPPAVPTRGGLADALADLDTPWTGGPRGEDARALLAGHAALLAARLDEFDRRAAELRDGRRPTVVTHGEPHPGNVLRRDDGTLLLVDWDTVGRAVPERDVWLVAATADDLDRYAAAAGRPADPGALALYRLRWALDDAAGFAGLFHGPHAATADTELAWSSLDGVLRELAATG